MGWKGKMIGLSCCLAISNNTAWAASDEIKQYSDKEAAGWAYKLSDTAYVIERPGCRIQWNAVEPKDKEQWYLSVKQQCNLDFEDQASIHEAILEHIAKQIPLRRFDTLHWGRFTYEQDYSWSIPIVLASYNSPEYTNYRRYYPNAKYNDINAIFGALANKARAYQPLADIFADFNMAIRLDSVEKVFTAKAGKLPFYQELTEHEVSRTARVMYDVGVSYFSLLPAE